MGYLMGSFSLLFSLPFLPHDIVIPNATPCISCSLVTLSPGFVYCLRVSQKKPTSCTALHRTATVPTATVSLVQPRSRICRDSAIGGRSPRVRGDRRPCRSRTVRQSCWSRQTRASLPRARFAMYVTINNRSPPFAPCSIRS